MSANEDVRVRWLEEERRVRARLGAPGLSTPEQLKAWSGMEFLRRMLAGELPPPPFAQTLGFTLVAFAPGEAVFQGTPALEHYNPIGSVHGGYFFTLLDSAAACAVHTLLPAGIGYTSLEMKIHFIRGLTRDTGPVRSIGRVVHNGRRTSVAEARIEDAAGKLYATGTTTCLQFPLP